MSKFEYENIATPDECVRLTFDDVLGRTTISMEQHNKSIEELNTHGNRYQTAYFLRGSHSGIRALLLQSLQQNATARGGFAVQLLPDGIAFICYAPRTMNNLFGPDYEWDREVLSVWRVGSEYFMMDYQKHLDALVPFLEQKGVVREEMSFAAQQLTLENQWRQHKSTFHCDSCEKDHPIEDCDISSVGKPFEVGKGGRLSAIFVCPRCTVNRMDWVPAPTGARITINDFTEPSELAALASNAVLTLDVTNLDLGRLPSHVKAALYTEATTFSAPQLHASGDINAKSATSFSAPLLKESGDINASSATSFRAPLLHTSGNINAPSLIEPSELSALVNNPGLRLDVTDFDLGRLPAHVKAALYTEATTFRAPLLQTSANIYAKSATSFSAPLLHTSANIYANSATIFSTPLLETSGDINAKSATSFNVPLLQKSGYIDAKSATSFSAPQLRTSQYIDANSATSFSAPLLKESGHIYAKSATSFSAPLLQTAGSIDASSAMSFSAPLLEESGDINAGSATSFSAPSLKESWDIYASSATSFSAPLLKESGDINAKCRTGSNAIQPSELGKITAPAFVMSEFAKSLKCWHCHAHISANEWPTGGDNTPFYTQKTPGNYTVSVGCTHCGQTTHVVWDENPGAIVPLDFITYTMKESKPVGHKLRVGMTLDELIQLLGEPDGNSDRSFCWLRPEGTYMLTLHPDDRLACVVEAPDYVDRPARGSGQRDVCAKCGVTLEARVKAWRTPPTTGVVRIGSMGGGRLFFWCDQCECAICGGCGVDGTIGLDCPFCGTRIEAFGDEQVKALLLQKGGRPNNP